MTAQPPPSTPAAPGSGPSPPPSLPPHANHPESPPGWPSRMFSDAIICKGPSPCMFCPQLLQPAGSTSVMRGELQMGGQIPSWCPTAPHATTMASGSHSLRLSFLSVKGGHGSPGHPLTLPKPGVNNSSSRTLGRGFPWQASPICGKG